MSQARPTDPSVLTLRRYLTVNPAGRTDIFVKPPRLGANEIAIGVTINIPKAIFNKPFIQATITVPAEAGVPATIEAGVIGNMADAIRQATGLEVSLTVVPPEES